MPCLQILVIQILVELMLCAKSATMRLSVNVLLELQETHWTIVVSIHVFDILIHSAASQSRPVVIIVFSHVVCPYVHPDFSKSSNAKQIQVKTMFTTKEFVGLDEWIMDDTCHVLYIL